MEPWKDLLLQRIEHYSPATGGPWQPELKWIFTEMRRVGLSRKPEDRFASCLLRTWEQLRPALVQQQPTCTEECLRQPLVWNLLLLSDRGHMMGSRQHVSWGAMAAGPAHSLGEWLDFWQLTVEVQGARLARMRGSAVHDQ